VDRWSIYVRYGLITSRRERDTYRYGYSIIPRLWFIFQPVPERQHAPQYELHLESMHYPPLPILIVVLDAVSPVRIASQVLLEFRNWLMLTC
jgi:hypothetical protein